MEVAFYHKPSRTLLVTDAVIFVPRKPPECISKESLLASAKNGLAVRLLSKGKDVPEEPVTDNVMNRQKGRNMCSLWNSFSLAISGVKLQKLSYCVIQIQAGRGWFFRYYSWVLLIYWNQMLLLLKCPRS